MNNLRVLIVTAAYPTPSYPGRGLAIQPQVDALRALGLDITVNNFDARDRTINYLRGVESTMRLAKPTLYDVIHAHYVYAGLVARFQFRLPLVLSFLGSDVVDKRTRWLSKLVSRLVDAVIVKSNRIKGILGRRDAHVIPNGVNLDLFTPMSRSEARRALGLNETDRYVLFVGSRTSPAKRFDRAEASLKVLQNRAQYGDVKLLGIHNRTIPHSRMPLYLNAANVLLMTSDWEGSPNVIKEAMSCNLPIVSTDVGDVQELMAGTEGCYVTAHLPEEIAMHLACALDHGRPTNGRERIQPLADHNIAQRVVGVYRSVVSSNAHV